MSLTTKTWLDRTLYPRTQNNWDDQSFREAVLGLLRMDNSLLDLGAGAGVVRQMNFKPECGRVAGVDPDPRVLENPNLHEALVGTGEAIPYPDSRFDVVISNNVLEHLERPAAVFREVSRVLKDGGVFLAKTPNRNHYVTLLARLTPTWFHKFVNRMRGRAEEDTFPTVYRANSARQLRRLAQAAGFSVVSIRAIEGRPEYLRSFGPLYLLGFLYERLVNASELFAPFRVVLIGVFRKEPAHLTTGSAEASSCRNSFSRI